MENININELEQLNDEDLYLLIGQEVLVGEKSLKQLSPKEIIEKTKVWFKLNMPLFQERICSNRYIRDIYDNQEVSNLATAVVDLIAGALTGIAPATAAYLLYRQGVKFLCKTHWES